MWTLYDATSPNWNIWFVWFKGFKSLDNYSKDSSIGCFLEADLDYPDELHDLHNDYPLEGGKIKVTEEMLSEYQLQIIKE